MTPRDELRKLAKKFNDKSRPEPTVVGNQVLVSHKLKSSGEIVNEETFDPKIDISILTLNDLRFLDAWREAGWDLEKACGKLGIEVSKAKRSYEKCRYFEFEDKKIKALSKVPTPEFVAAKNLEGFYEDKFSDGQRDHLKELAKITGAYKATNQISLTQNVFNLPLPPALESEFKALADKALDAEIVHE